MLSEEDLIAALRRHWDYSGKNEDLAHEIYDDEAVLEFPQSGERFEGVDNFREWRRQYPAEVKFHLRQINSCEDLAVTEYLISYNGAPWMFTVSIMRFRDDKVVHERIYIMDGWEAPDWRAPWRSPQRADSIFPDP
ncbi:MAG TPA: nuclear transport factor 2 family protein [Acidimicrobiia bacterium]|nr:nuclear transport factor 2 family protein [Acidimicrobiia bacterium]